MRPHVVVGFAFLVSCSVTALAQPYAFGTIAGLAGEGWTGVGTPDGTNSAARFTALAGAVVDTAGNVYVADGDAIRKVTPFGTNWAVTTLAGVVNAIAHTDGTNDTARFNYPQGLAIDAAGNLFVADTYNHAIRKVSHLGANWVVTTIAGSAPPNMTSGTNDGTNYAARFFKPTGIAVDSAGVVYVADTYNHTIRRLSPSGTNWVVTTLAGSPTASGNVDATGANAQFVKPAGIAVGAGGVLYVADFGGHTIRKITPPGAGWVVTTLAGLGGSAGTNDGLGSAARFNQPFGIVVDGAANLMVADSGNQTIRRITPTGFVSTIGGLPGVKGSANGIGSAARFVAPQGLGLDSAGKIYVAEYGGDPFVQGGYTVRQGQVAALLQITKVNNQVVLSWPAGLTGYVAQVCYSLPHPTWTNILTIPSVSGDYWVLPNAMQPGPNFYRLFK